VENAGFGMLHATQLIGHAARLLNFNFAVLDLGLT